MSQNIDKNHNEQKSSKNFYSWPIRIRRLFYNVNNADEHNDEIEYSRVHKVNLTSLFSKSDVEGWLYSLLPIFYNTYGFFPALRIIQGTFEWAMKTCREDDKPDEVESAELHLLSEICNPIGSILRKAPFTGENKRVIHNNMVSICGKISNDVASWFIGETKESLNVKSKSLENHFTIFDGSNTFIAHYESDAEAPYFLYHCRRTHMLEIAFPLFAENIVISVFIVESFIPENCEADIRAQCKREFVALGIADEPCIQHITDKSELEEIIVFFLKEVSLYQKILQRCHERNWSHFKLDAVNEFSTLIHKASPSALVDGLEKLYEWISGSEWMAHYEIMEKRIKADNQLVLVWSIPKKELKKGKPHNKLPTISLNYESIVQLSDSANSRLNKGRTYLLMKDDPYFPHALNIQGEFPIFLINYDTDFSINHAFFIKFSYNIDLHKKDFVCLLDFFDAVCTDISLKTSFTRAISDCENYDNTLRTISHELAQQYTASQFTMRLIYSVWILLSNCALYNRPTDLIKTFLESRDEYEKYYHDLESIHLYIKMQSDLAKERVESSLSEQKTEFNIYKDCFNPIITAFRIPMRVKLLGLIRKENQNSINFYGYKFSIMQMVFNLLSNAVKYCYDGTNIHIRYFTSQDVEKHFQHICITDYGYGIPSAFKTEIFKAGFRLDNVRDLNGEPYQETHTTGMGYGLAVVNTCMRIHNGKVNVESTKISNYNVPLMKACLSERLRERIKLDEEERRKINDEFVQLTFNRQYSEIVCREVWPRDLTDDTGDQDTGLTYRGILKEISRPTFKTEFTVIIPRGKAPEEDVYEQ